MVVGGSHVVRQSMKLSIAFMKQAASMTDHDLGGHRMKRLWRQLEKWSKKIPNYLCVKSPSKLVTERHLCTMSVAECWNCNPSAFNFIMRFSDHAQCISFCEWVRERKYRMTRTFFRKFFFSDEAHFWVNGYVNSQNYRIWGTENPHELVAKSLHSERLTVWVAISERRLIGPFYRTQNIDQVVYRSIIRDDFLPALQAANVDLSSTWFQQDNATPHTANATMDLLHSIFGSRVISKDPRWPPRSQRFLVVRLSQGCGLS